MPSRAAALAGGGYVVVSWAGAANAPADDVSNLSFQRYTANGTPIGSPASVGDKGGLSNYRVVPLSGGGFAVAWNAPGPTILTFTRMFTADGTPVGEPVLAGGVIDFCSPGGCPYQNLVGLTPMDDGGYVVVWQNGFGMGVTLGYFTRRFKPDGSPGAAVDRSAASAAEGSPRPVPTVSSSATLAEPARRARR